MGNRMKMSPADRAKQFMPFAALKGYEEALRAKEKVVVPKMELSEEMLEDLDRGVIELFHSSDTAMTVRGNYPLTIRSNKLADLS